jgi:membrane protein DedA with SNARE-associated domain
VARTFTNTFAGIGQGDVPGFLLAQAAAAMVAVPLFAWFFRGRSESS